MQLLLQKARHGAAKRAQDQFIGRGVGDHMHAVQPPDRLQGKGQVFAHVLGIDDLDAHDVLFAGALR